MSQPTTPSKQDKVDWADPNVCSTSKETYEKCFFKWYTEKFLKGTNKMECEEEWNNYNACVKKRLKHLGLDHVLQEEFPKQSMIKDESL
mmetsp:Transcript_9032/g.12417  ORF Transcript_9032/g.12417 Transcript_9032/m.12417 type:complete len:89 (+) Transcript_9032:41-307(+)